MNTFVRFLASKWICVESSFVWFTSTLTAGMALAFSVLYLQHLDHTALVKRPASKAKSLVAFSEESAMPAPPFAINLATSPDRFRLLQSLRSTVPTGVKVSDIRLLEHPASQEALGRIELSAVTRGPYPGTKLLLKSLLDRFEASNFRQLQIRTLNPSAEVETSFTVVIWSPPFAPRRGP